jgi:hypothetical protein
MTADEWRLYGTAANSVRKMSDLLLDYDRVCQRTWFERLLGWFSRRWKR